MVREKNGEKTPVWRKLTGQDHYFHSLAYMTTAIKYFNGEFAGFRTEETPLMVLSYGSVSIGLQSRLNLWGHQSRAY